MTSSSHKFPEQNGWQWLGKTISNHLISRNIGKQHLTTGCTIMHEVMHNISVFETHRGSGMLYDVGSSLVITGDWNRLCSGNAQIRWKMTQPKRFLGGQRPTHCMASVLLLTL